MSRPRLHLPSDNDAAFIFRLACENDLRWPTVSRMATPLTPAAVFGAVTASTYLGYVVSDEHDVPVGLIGLVDADLPSRIVSIDGQMDSTRADSYNYVSAASEMLLDEIERKNMFRFVYCDTYEELGPPIVTFPQLWKEQVRIPSFATIDGIEVTRVTRRLELSAWGKR